MAKIKFYRGAQGASLPSHQDGAIFIVAADNNRGDMYVDIENGKRLHIVPEQPVIEHTTAEWSTLGLAKSEQGKIYVYSDYSSQTIEGDTYPVPAIKIGDGNAYIVDLPFYNVVTQAEKDFWNHKVDAYMDDVNEENLILTYGLS